MLTKEKPEIEKAVKRLVEISEDEKLRLTLEMRKQDEFDYYATLASATEDAREEGMKQGLEQGLEKGRKDTAFETAARMKADGLSSEKIQKYTGLNLIEIENL